MRFLPAENIILKTRLNEAEILKGLSSLIESRQYEGTIDGPAFSIQRIIRYRNSFLPRIKGVIQNDYDGNTVTIKMRMHILVLVFLIVWVVGVALAGVASFSNREKPDLLSLLPFGMVLFAYVLAMVAFKFESRKSIKSLQQVLEAEIREPL